jgi:hypothetical protein
MKTCLTLFLGLFLLAGTGCEEKKDPRERPGFIDTSDPSSVGKTMIPPPKSGKTATSLGGSGMKKGPGVPGAPGPK